MEQDRKEQIKQLLKQLEGLDWCVMSGLAVEIYTSGKRKAGEDIDLLVSSSDIDLFAQRLGCKSQRRRFEKDTFFFDHYGFETCFCGLQVEASSGFPGLRMKNKKINKVFNNKRRKKYLGLNVYVEPIEELIVHKVSMSRSKDLRDLRLLAKEEKNINLLIEFLKDWGIYPQAFEQLKKLKVI